MTFDWRGAECHFHFLQLSLPHTHIIVSESQYMAIFAVWQEVENLYSNPFLTFRTCQLISSVSITQDVLYPCCHLNLIDSILYKALFWCLDSYFWKLWWIHSARRLVIFVTAIAGYFVRSICFGKKMWTLRGLNPWPSACKADDLPLI